MLLTLATWALVCVFALGLAVGGQPRAGGWVLVGASVFLAVACIPVRWWRL